ncbi:MAG: M20 family metallopeptidase [Candidatus Atribacteria bacterium]|nr:M20 family metallopeptidase [Candidatus Atribacteria bacterium]
MTISKDDITEIKLLKEKAADETDKFRERSIEMANYIFDNPELSAKEFKTKDYLTAELKDNGFQIQEGIGGLDTAFRAQFSFEKPGPTVAFIAEYDALPNIGHACHHHIIASASVNVAIAMSKLGRDLCGKIICIGTPAEECMDAKGMMRKNGAFDGIDVVLMFHGGSRNNTKLTILAFDGLEFNYKGKSAHAAASPHEGINALDAVILLFTSVNALRQQLREDVRIHGNVIKGGDAVNIIPESASARFYIRSQHRKYLNEVVEKVKNCARGAALQTGAELTISVFEDPGNGLLKNSFLIKEYEENFESIGEKLDEEPFLLGSTDIGNLSYYVPVIHPMVKTAEEGCALHTVEFLNYGKTGTAYHGMMVGMKSIAMTAVRILMDGQFLKNVKEDFIENTKRLSQ